MTEQAEVYKTFLIEARIEGLAYIEVQARDRDHAANMVKALPARAIGDKTRDYGLRDAKLVRIDAITEWTSVKHWHPHDFQR